MKKILLLGEGFIYYKCDKILYPKTMQFVTNPDYIISVQWSKLISNEQIKKVNGNAFNLHNADTQTYRGSHCIDWEIYNKEPKHAVTIHWMTDKVDLGPIAFQEWIPIDENDTPKSLWQKSVPVAVNLFSKLLNYIVEDKEIPKIEVDPKIGKFYKKGNKPDTRQ